MIKKQQIEQTGEFYASGKDGQTYRIIEFTHFVDTTTIHITGSSRIPGMKSLRLPNGKHINPIDGDVYEIAETKERITRKR